MQSMSQYKQLLSGRNTKHAVSGHLLQANIGQQLEQIELTLNKHRPVTYRTHGCPGPYVIFCRISSSSSSLTQVWCIVMQIQTEMMGDIHHYAWRARHRNQTVYINKRDSECFGDWTSEQCAVSTSTDPVSTDPWRAAVLHVITRALSCSM